MFESCLFRMMKLYNLVQTSVFYISHCQLYESFVELVVREDNSRLSFYLVLGYFR